jgi:hypothetical protein
VRIEWRKKIVVRGESRPQSRIRGWEDDPAPELKSQIDTTSCAIVAIDSRSRIWLFSEMRGAHGFRMEIELVFPCGEIGVAGRR